MLPRKPNISMNVYSKRIAFNDVTPDCFAARDAYVIQIV